MQNLGKRLKTLRNKRGLTLAQLGQRVGLSASHLSQVERGVTMPSLSNLAAIASALETEMGYFFEDNFPPPDVVKANQGRRIEGAPGIVIELLSADPLGKKIQPYCMVCQPGTLGNSPPAYPGERFGFVLEGQLVVTVGEDTFVLKAGDSIHYQAHQSCSWRNEGEEESVILWAALPPVSESELKWESSFVNT